MKAQTNSRLLVLILLLSAWSGTYFTAAPRQDSGAAIIGGRVLADATGEPIAKASVEVVRIEAQRAVLTRVVTDERGVFQAKGLLPGRYELRATAEGFVPSSQTGPSMSFCCQMERNLARLISSLSRPLPSRAPSLIQWVLGFQT